MFEWLAIPCLLVASSLVPKGKQNDKKVIEEIFKNTNTCIAKGDIKQYPRFKSKHVKQGYTTYIYTLPKGLSKEGIEGLYPTLRDGLDKEIEIDFDGVLKIDVFEEWLPMEWKYTEDLAKKDTWQVPVGKNHKGILYHDFEKYAHFLCGGVPGFGKTVFIKTVFHTLMMNQWNNVEFYFLDLKGGLEFYKYRGLPQVKSVACDIYDSVEVLHDIVEEMKDTEKEFRNKGYVNISDTPIKKRRFIIVDEGAELAPNIVEKDKKKYAEACQSYLSEIARIGRALGYRLIYCTQYPSSKSVDMSIKMNIVARLSFVAASQVSSRVILDEVGAEDLPALPGRAIYKVEKARKVQTPFIKDGYMFKKFNEMEGIIDAVVSPREDREVIDHDRHTGNSEDKASPTNS